MFTSRFPMKVITLMTILIMTLSSVQPALAAPPLNDNFADPVQITSLPFNVDASNVEATFEADEQTTGCWFGYPLKTVWFKYTPLTDVSLTAFGTSSGNSPLVVVYSGDTLNSLSPIGCSYFNSQLAFLAQAGVTYYFQLSELFGGEGTLPFTLQVSPPPEVNINYGPGDPSIYDNVSFSANVNDPGQVYGLTYAWTISDGTTSDQQFFNHQFASDGDYTVNLTATTADGRSGSAPSQVIQVRTRDVSINKLGIPQTARVNQTKAINVEIKNNLYSDYVQVTLIKGLPGGGEQAIGTLTLYVPARSTRPTIFKFSYTFTSDDATVGKVVFKAVATIANGRDALPSDNTAIGTTLIAK